MREPIVTEVLALYRVARTDDGATPALVLELNPPAYLWNALQFYVGCLDRVRGDEARRRVEQMKSRNAARRSKRG